MARNDRHHDYGMRGRPDPREERFEGARRYDADQRGTGFPPPDLPNRVTERYNRDYTLSRRPPPTRNYNPYGGDHPDRMVDAQGYRRPYTTIGGTRTFRGSPPPPPPSGAVDAYDDDYIEYL
jgi:hypothetical protein